MTQLLWQLGPCPAGDKNWLALSRLNSQQINKQSSNTLELGKTLEEPNKTSSSRKIFGQI